MRTDTEAARSLFDLIMRMLEYEPAERITLEQALDHAFFKTEEARQQDEAKISLCELSFQIRIHPNTWTVFLCYVLRDFTRKISGMIV